MRRAPSLAMLWPFLAVALPALAALLAPMPAVDLAYQLRAGGEILDARAIPAVDAWTFTVFGAPWTDQQWGAQVLLALVYRVAGWTGLAVLRATLVAVTCWLLLRLARLRAPRLGSMGATLLVLAAFTVMANSLALRPQLFAIPLFVLVLLLLADRDAHPRRVWAIPLIALLWANLHGSFPLPLVLLGLALFADVLDRRSPRLLGVVTLASVVATLVNPLGLGVWTYLVDLATNPTISSRVSEWRPPTPLEPIGALFYLSVLAVVGLLARRARRAPAGVRRWPAAPALLTLLGFGLLAAITGRGLAWWPPAALFVVAPIAAEEVGLFRLSSSSRPSRLNTGVVALIVVAGIALLPAWRPLGPAGAPVGTLLYAPQGLAAALPNFGVPDPVFNPQFRVNPRVPRIWAPQALASWFELVAPTNLYAVDSRIELFPADVWADLDVLESGTFLDPLGHRGVTYVVTTPSETAFEAALAASGRWTRTYTDADGSIWALNAIASAPTQP